MLFEHLVPFFMGFAAPRTLITGGAGFIGSHVVEQCLARGHVVLVYDNFSAGRREHLPSESSTLTIVRGDVLDESALRSALVAFKPTHVVHMAALHYIPYCITHPMETIDSNVKGTEQVLSLLAEPTILDSLQHVVVASSAAVYAPSTDLHSEESLLGPTDIYGLSKYVNEMQARMFHRRTGKRVVIARLFNAYGPRETHAHLIPEIFRQLRSGAQKIQLGNVQTKRSFVYVQDAARAVVDFFDVASDSCEVFNVGSHEEYDAIQLLEHLAVLLGRRIEWQSVSTRQRLSDRPRLQPSLAKIEQVTGWKERFTLDAGLREIIRLEGV